MAVLTMNLDLTESFLYGIYSILFAIFFVILTTLQ